MLTKVEVINQLGDNLAIPLGGVHAGYIIDSIDGLDPVKATLSSSPRALLAGEVFQASRREKRNLILNLDLEPDYVTTTVEGLRQSLYRYVSPGEPITVSLYFDGVQKAKIAAVVEDVGSPLFSKESKVTISLICFEPDFMGYPRTISATSVGTSAKHDITNVGNLRAGMKFAIKFKAATSGFTIVNNKDSGTFTYSGTILINDIFEINTIPGEKSIKRRRGNTLDSVLAGVNPASRWIQLLPGPNAVVVTASSGAVDTTISHVERYGGF